MAATGTATTPLELLGSASGLSVVDPTTILTRLWYFDGKFLRADGFRLDQDYVRSLAALSHQATGSGIVHGFGVTRPPTGDRLVVGPGLALAPSGRVVFLPADADLSIADLIGRSAGTADPTRPAPAGVADFSRCPPDPAAGPDVTVAAHPLYLLTVAGIEALCGEEERFGQLCVDACATETDRSTVVEGVCFRVRELTLALPTSTAVPFDGRHLRSRLASAYFQAERAAVPAMISGLGLRTPVWCAGADAIGGEEVPLAVLDRAGGVTTLLDTWTARRELQETTPRRYWAARMAMRPWDTFLAQVLQFQCQLLDLGTDPGQPAGTDGDPCRTERDALAAAADVLQGLPADPDGRIEALRANIAAALGTATVPATAAGASGSLLLDGGIVELPPAGYLPVSLSRPLQDQVRALFGPGVDLQFCAVRPDYVPEALQEAQHLDRISLTRGLDDPGRLEEVDVLVPDGVVGAPPAPATGLTGVARLFPTVRGVQGDDPASALTLSVVVRDRSGPGWSLTAAGFGEAPQRLSVPDLAAAALRAVRRAFGAAGSEPAREDEGETVAVRPDAEHDRIRGAGSFTQRLVAEGRAALRRRAQLIAAGPGRPPADRPLADGENRPVAIWLDAETNAGLDTLPVNGSTGVRARATVYSRASTSPVLNDVQVTGVIRVVDVLTLGDRKVLRTVVDGVAELRLGDRDPRLVPLKAFPLSWALAGGRRTLVVGAGDPVSAIVSLAETGGAPRHVTGEAVLRPRTNEPAPAPPPGTPGPLGPPGGLGRLGAAAGDQPAATVELDESPDALTPGSTGRTVAESVIAVIGAELAAPGRDPGFSAYATDRMLGGLGQAGTSEVTATADWVFFARRRTRTCAGDVTPVRTRTYRLFHRRQDDRDLRVADVLRGLRPGAVDPAGLGFDPVATVQFAAGEVTLRSAAEELRAGWLAADRGTEILLAGVGDFDQADGNGDGESVALGRLATVRSVLADLADSTDAQVRYLPEIPAEFHQPGLDGAMFTIGATPVTRTCVTVFRLLPDGFKRVLALLHELGDSVPLEDVFTRADVQVEAFVVRFVDDEIVDPDAVRAAWQDLRVSIGVLGVPSATADAELAGWRRRAAQIARAIGLASVEDDHVASRTGDCGAVLFTAVDPVIN